jgi:hypothetical protein
LKLTALLVPTLAAVALAAPCAAHAATLTTDKACYGPGEPVLFTGLGFTASGQAALTTGGQQLGLVTVNPVGEFELGLTAPLIDAKQRTDTFTATDQANLALTASVGVRLTSIDVTAKPKNGKPGRRQLIKARGFTTGKTLWAHIRRGRSKRNVKVGKLKKPCGTLSLRKRLFSPNAKTGAYTVQFDAKRKYSSETAPSVTFVVTVFQTIKPASASGATTGERWTRTR